MPFPTPTPIPGAESNSSLRLSGKYGRRVPLTEIEAARLRLLGDSGGGGAPRASLSPTPSAPRLPDWQPKRNSRGTLVEAGGPDDRRLVTSGGQEFYVQPENLTEINGTEMFTRGVSQAPSLQITGAEVGPGPTVETPTLPSQSTGVSAGNLDAEPSLFPDSSGTNAFSEWWKQTADVTGTASGGAEASLTGDGGSIWGDAGLLSGDAQGSSTLGQQESFGAELTAELPQPESAFNPVPEPTGIPVEPNTLPQEYQWTTSPGDERFLPGSQPEAETRTVSGLDLRTFGDPSANNSLTLGQYLSTPLANMNFGGGYPVQGGVADTSRSNIATGALQIDPLTGRPFDLERLPMATGDATVTPGNDWRENAANPTFNENAYGEQGDFNAWPKGIEFQPRPPEGMHIIGHDEKNGQPIYEDEQGNKFVNPGTGRPIVTPGTIGQGQYYDWTSGRVRPLNVTATARTDNLAHGPGGYGQSLTSREGAALMSQQAFGGNPNRMLVSDEELIAQSEFGGARYVGPGNRDRNSRLRSLYPRGVFTDAGRTGGTAVGGGG